MAPEATRFSGKSEARDWVWDRLQAERLARFPFPPHGRIPNFAGAAEAAARPFAESPWRDAKAIKVNPDSPQKPVRERALGLGIRVYVPTPRLAGGFMLLDPQTIPEKDFGRAASLRTLPRYARPVSLEKLPQLDAIVTGCVAVTRTGKRCGKGEGYSDIEFALLRELGHAPVPVATTVHDAQLVADFPIEANDLPLSLICTPRETIRIAEPLPAPERLDWSRLTEADRDRMSVLRDVERLLAESRS